MLIHSWLTHLKRWDVIVFGCMEHFRIDWLNLVFREQSKTWPEETNATTLALSYLTAWRIWCCNHENFEKYLIQSKLQSWQVEEALNWSQTIFHIEFTCEFDIVHGKSELHRQQRRIFLSTMLRSVPTQWNSSILRDSDGHSFLRDQWKDSNEIRYVFCAATQSNVQNKKRICRCLMGTSDFCPGSNVTTSKTDESRKYGDRFLWMLTTKFLPDEKSQGACVETTWKTAEWPLLRPKTELKLIFWKTRAIDVEIFVVSWTTQFNSWTFSVSLSCC